MVEKVIKNIEISPNTVILIISDVHIGASKMKHKLFTYFLKEILNKKEENKLRNLKYLMILGDFFDFITESFRDFKSKKFYRKIFKYIDEIQSTDIKLLFCLGNHEIDTTGDYDKEFKQRKEALIKEFDKKVKRNLLRDDNCYQYIFLNKSGIITCDSISDVDENKQYDNLNDLEFGEKTILLTHGYQFDPLLEHWSRIWQMGLDNPFDVAKEFNNIAWNDFINPIHKELKNFFKTIDISMKDSIEEEFDKIAAKERKKKRDVKFVYDFLADARRNNIEKEGPKDKNPFIRKILDGFLPDYEKSTGRPPITHVIFGHTHDAFDLSAFTFNNREILIENSGAWQQVNFPSYIEISTDLRMTLVKIT